MACHSGTRLSSTDFGVMCSDQAKRVADGVQNEGMEVLSGLQLLVMSYVGACSLRARIRIYGCSRRDG